MFSSILSRHLVSIDIALRFGGAMSTVGPLYCHVEVERSVPDRGEIYVDRLALPTHSAVIRRPGILIGRR